MSRKHPLKKYQTTIVMIVLALGFGGFAWVEYQRSLEEKQTERTAEMIIGWEDDSQYKSARLDRGNEVIEVVRGEDNVWKVTSPVEDLGDDFNIEAWLSDMGTEKGRKIDAKKDADGEILWAEYGLVENLKTLTLTKKDGESVNLQFAEHSAFDGSYFLKYKDQVWIGEKPWVSVLSKNLKHLRERNIFRHSKNPKAFSVNYGGKRQFEVQKDEAGDWHFTNDKELKISDEDVKHWFAALRKVSVVEFLDQLQEQDFRKFGQKKPLVKIEFVFDEETKETWTVSKAQKKDDRERYYIRINDSSTLFEADKAFVERFMASKDFFRDGREFFQVDLEQLTQVKLSGASADTVIVEKQDSGEWKLQSEVNGYQFDATLWESYLTALSNLEAEVFLKPSQLKGVKKPQLQLEMTLKNAKAPLVWSFGDEFSSDKTFAQRNPVVYTKTSGGGAFAVQKSAMQSLALEKMLKKNEIKQSANESEAN